MASSAFKGGNGQKRGGGVGGGVLAAINSTIFPADFVSTVKKSYRSGAAGPVPADIEMANRMHYDDGTGTPIASRSRSSSKERDAQDLSDQ